MTPEETLGSVRYGFALYHAIKVEGIPFLFMERTPSGSITSTGYTIDPTLMIDESSKVGSRIDERTGIGRAFDLSFGLERSAVTAALFKKPSNITRLTATVAHGETTALRVDSTTGFASSGAVYIGNERIEYAATSGTQFQTLTRGTPATDWKGQAFSTESQIATWVTDAPMFWRGREIILYAIPVDPFGRVVSASFADYLEIWRGNIASEPRPYPGGWSLSCKPIDRKLDERVATSFSGKATLKPNPDPMVRIVETSGVWLNVTNGSGEAWGAGNVPSGALWQPFAGLVSSSTYYSMAFIQGLLMIQWMAKVAADGVTAYFPATPPKFIPGGPYDAADTASKATPSSGKAAWQDWQVKQMHVRAKVQTTGKTIKASALFMSNIPNLSQPVVWGFSEYDFATDPSSMLMPAGAGMGMNSAGEETVAALGDTDEHWIPLPIMLFYGNQLGAMSITLDDDDPALVPASGWVVLEGNDKIFVIEYENKEVNGSEITLQTVNFKGTIDDILEAMGDQESPTVSCKFCFIDNGQVVDTMRRMLYSSGRGNNDDGTFDTLPAGSGYDISAIDDNFAVELDGAWSDLSADFLLDEGVSFASIYGPLLALSQRAVVARNAGPGMRLTCVSTSVIETAEYMFTLTDSHILAGEGGGSVRAVSNPETPNRVEVDIERYRKDMGRVVVNDIVSQRADGLHTFAIKVNGFNRDETAPAVIGWSRSLFAARGGRLVYEVHCVPWLGVQVGDSIRIESTHFNFWDRATGLRGYTGSARVLGNQSDLKTGRVILHVAIAGAFQTFSLCPSAPLISNDNTTNPTILAIAGKYHTLMTAYLTAEPSGFELLVYHPGTDQTGDTVTVSAVTGTILTTTYLAISAHSLSTALVNGTTHLTIPFTADDSTVQAYHMHTDTAGAVWQ